MSPVHYPAQPSKEQQELRAKAWRLDWRRKLANDQSIFREAYECPGGMWNRNICIFCMIWAVIFVVISGFWAYVDGHDLVTLLIVLFGVCLVLFLFLPMMYAMKWSTPKWIVLQLTRKFFVYTITDAPDLDFMEMVRSERKLTYPRIAVELESIKRVKKGFGSYFVREKPGRRGMIIVNIVYSSRPPYSGYDYEEEFPVPISVLPTFLGKLKGAAHSVVIDPIIDV